MTPVCYRGDVLFLSGACRINVESLGYVPSVKKARIIYCIVFITISVDCSRHAPLKFAGLCDFAR
jgi:hypothetical protein